MKIAQIAPIIENVPPTRYGGTERVVSALTEELVKRGHEVTLFATGNSKTQANLSSICDQGLRERNITDEYTKNGTTLLHVGEAYARAREFDVMHDHIGVMSLPTAQVSPTPVVITLHGAFYDYNKTIYTRMNKPYYVTISDSQAIPVPDLHRVGTIYNGLSMSDYPFYYEDEGYLLNVGRITPQKGTHLAVRLAHQLQLPLIIAAKLEESQRDYFEKEVEPYLSDTIRWIGEVTEEERNKLMSRAYCFLHPALWEEPFGLTLIEAMACGCPVVALRHGSIPEIIEDGKNGFIADDFLGMLRAIKKIPTIQRSYCRNYVLTKFSVDQMVDQYEQVYELLTARKSSDSIDKILHSNYDFQRSYSFS
jgi:glycosyltransferase involved in cell wall biosynthesis